MHADDPQRPLWLAVRRALLLLVGAIEQHYGLQRDPRACAKIDATE